MSIETIAKKSIENCFCEFCLHCFPPKENTHIFSQLIALWSGQDVSSHGVVEIDNIISIKYLSTCNQNSTKIILLCASRGTN